MKHVEAVQQLDKELLQLGPKQLSKDKQSMP
jgi:hypothetical protein